MGWRTWSGVCFFSPLLLFARFLPWFLNGFHLFGLQPQGCGF